MDDILNAAQNPADHGGGNQQCSGDSEGSIPPQSEFMTTINGLLHTIYFACRTRTNDVDGCSMSRRYPSNAGKSFSERAQMVLLGEIRNKTDPEEIVSEYSAGTKVVTRCADRRVNHSNPIQKS